MTSQQIIEHWRKGARDALKMAQISHREGLHEFALFHCHLAAEKALKAAYLEEKKTEAPKIHQLLKLALSLNRQWTEAQQRDLAELTDFVIASRYADPRWLEQEATPENAAHWIEQTKELLSLLSA